MKRIMLVEQYSEYRIATTTPTKFSPCDPCLAFLFELGKGPQARALFLFMLLLSVFLKFPKAL